MPAQNNRNDTGVHNGLLSIRRKRTFKVSIWYPKSILNAGRNLHIDDLRLRGGVEVEAKQYELIVTFNVKNEIF